MFNILMFIVFPIVAAELLRKYTANLSEITDLKSHGWKTIYEEEK